LKLPKNLAVTYLPGRRYADCIEIMGKIKTEDDPEMTGVLNDAKNKLAE